MKNILFMHQTSAIGGGSYCLLNILKAIDRNKVSPLVCLASEGPLCQELSLLGIKYVIFKELKDIPYNKSLFRFKSVLAYYHISISQLSFKNLLSLYKIDVVYLNNMMLYPYLKSAKEYGANTILHCREHWPLNQHVFQLNRARHFVYKYADELIAINKYSASIFPEKKSTIVYDWIDMSERYEFMPMDSLIGEDASDKKIYLYTGGNQIIKGLLQVVKGFHLCIKDSNARLLIVGDICVGKGSYPKRMVKKVLSALGKKFYYNELNELLERDKRIRIIDSTYKIQHIYQQSYCMLSYFTIPHANLSLAEAIINNLVCVAAKTEESLEYSDDGNLCILFELGDFEDFSKKLEMLNDEYETIKNRMKLYSNTIQEKFSKDVNSFAINSIINSI